MSALLGLLVLALDVIAIVDVIKSAAPTNQKALWVILVLVLPVIGMALYFLIGKKK